MTPNFSPRLAIHAPRVAAFHDVEVQPGTAASKTSGASLPYDKLARNYFSTLCLVAAIVFGL